MIACRITFMKAVVEFRTYEYLDTYTCYADYGIGIILKRKNRSKLITDKKDFSKLRFADYYNNFKQFMNVVEFNELNNLFWNNKNVYNSIIVVP